MPAQLQGQPSLARAPRRVMRKPPPADREVLDRSADRLALAGVALAASTFVLVVLLGAHWAMTVWEPPRVEQVPPRAAASHTLGIPIRTALDVDPVDAVVQDEP